MARIDVGEGSTSKTKPLPKNLPQFLTPRNTTPEMLARPTGMPQYKSDKVNAPSWAGAYERTANQRRLNETIRTAPTYLPLFRSTAQGAQQFDPARQAEINNYRDNVLTGKAFGPMYKSRDPYVTEGYDPNGDQNRAAWQNAVDYQDAATRRMAGTTYQNNKKMLGGVGDAIGKAVTNVATGLNQATQPDWKKKWADVMATQWPTYGPPAPDASPWVAQPGGGGGGDQGGGGYGGYGGGGGGGGYNNDQRSWFDMYQWRF